MINPSNKDSHTASGLVHGNFHRVDNFKLNRSSLIRFIILSLLIWVLNLIVQQAFPTDTDFPFIIRNLFAATTVLLLVHISKRELAKNDIYFGALGITFSFITARNLFFGMLMAVIVLALFGSIVCVFVPFHFEAGSLSGTNAFKHSISFLVTNTLEELIFRGCALLILSKMYGWRKAVLFLALPFGLFHLYGLGLSIAGLKMVLTTASYSFIFCYAYIVTESIITAISVHWFSNVLLHVLTGLDGEGNALLQPMFHVSRPSFDIGLFAFLLSVAIVASLLFFIIRKKENSYD